MGAQWSNIEWRMPSSLDSFGYDFWDIRLTEFISIFLECCVFSLPSAYQISQSQHAVRINLSQTLNWPLGSESCNYSVKWLSLRRLRAQPSRAQIQIVKDLILSHMSPNLNDNIHQPQPYPIKMNSSEISLTGMWYAAMRPLLEASVTVDKKQKCFSFFDSEVKNSAETARKSRGKRIFYNAEVIRVR